MEFMNMARSFKKNSLIKFCIRIYSKYVVLLFYKTTHEQTKFKLIFYPGSSAYFDDWTLLYGILYIQIQ